MNKKQNGADTIAPDYVSSVIALIALPVFLFKGCEGLAAHSWAVALLFFAGFILALISLWITGTGYTLREDAILCSFLGIPYRKLPWSGIIQAGLAIQGIFPGWIGGPPEHFYIVLTLSGCKRFRPGKDSAMPFLFRHPRRAVILNARLLKSRIDLLEQYYGPLDYVDDRLIRRNPELRKYKHHTMDKDNSQK